MLASKKIARSTASSLKSTGSSVAKGKDSFIGYLYKRIMTIWKSMWGKTKSMMWVVSTGFIFLVLPFSIAYMMELQKQMMEMEHGNMMIGQ